ncbi:hypothetical protein HOP51_16825 [Halomonas sp. MCCC 1A11036]|uniref:Uncharacterized protein n=2 Tax=Billgrantia zhangzhouensis TaxID=2733481 RepID=A0ABS9AJ17_9GAMM|nr:hypothetical protein [Halomonas zhangzhouensis]
MAKKLDDSMAHQRTENTWRLSASAGAIIAGVGNLIHDGIRNGAQAGSIRLARMANSIWVKGLGLISRGLGFAAAGLMAFWDFKSFLDARRHGNTVLAGLYLFSVGAGVGAAAFLSGVIRFRVLGLSATGWGIILALAVIGLSLWIDFLKNNALQDWMSRSYFGRLESERYGSHAMEIEQFELALEALGADTDSKEDDSIPAGLLPQAE